jgi:hypothetical protein
MRTSCILPSGAQHFKAFAFDTDLRTWRLSSSGHGQATNHWLNTSWLQARRFPPIYNLERESNNTRARHKRHRMDKTHIIGQPSREHDLYGPAMDHAGHGCCFTLAHAAVVGWINGGGDQGIVHRLLRLSRDRIDTGSWGQLHCASLTLLPVLNREYTLRVSSGLQG